MKAQSLNLYNSRKSPTNRPILLNKRFSSYLGTLVLRIAEASGGVKLKKCMADRNVQIKNGYDFLMHILS